MGKIKKIKTHTECIALRLSPELKKRIEYIATKERRSCSDLIRDILKKELGL